MNEEFEHEAISNIVIIFFCSFTGAAYSYFMEEYFIAEILLATSFIFFCVMLSSLFAKNKKYIFAFLAVAFPSIILFIGYYMNDNFISQTDTEVLFMFLSLELILIGTAIKYYVAPKE
ncbi:hypothetical protein KMW28_18940 [Flammeovirga yaeyamensis]|uniref:Uncharacterized protein n=1 Tax=Flammeovirga yaeyamensis TaxID=367791 RepID=A0AAX1N3B2_9BACT|nr:hypothetical protein [Flammeovirga yaeyamensis]MBB3701232.1 hypothetical protein [Flammeovirga yaeyamensis]NMF38442.1 hypothetical protein [Flammeovirga yaeyamensis]QWG01697.1 hypothetical protein KMW28_18940 [Flammeovirga yaeyamensis]